MKEIERKFLVIGDFPTSRGWREHIKQGYLKPKDPQIRIRLYPEKEVATITIKYKTGLSFMRDEYEDNFSWSQALEVYEKCEYKLEKQRCHIPATFSRTLNWEIDVYEEPHKGLIIAEIELPNEDYKLPNILPDWIGEDVTDKKKYGNLYLAGYRE